MTHDIKNLLQSLNVLTSVAARDEAARLARNCRRWCAASCPLIERRLADTLEKLQRPQAAGETYVAARAWWEALARQYRGEGVEFERRAIRRPARACRARSSTASPTT